MNNWIHFASFQHQTDMWAIKGNLETNGISTFIKESAPNPYPNLDLYDGGIKLFVKENNKEQAQMLLEESNSTYCLVDNSVLNPFVGQIAKIVKHVPFLKDLSIEQATFAFLLIITMFLGFLLTNLAI